MKRCFFFQRRTDPQWSRGRRVGFWGWNLVWLLLGCLGVSLISMVLSVGSYPLSLCAGFWETPLLILLNTLPVMALGLIFYGLIGRVSGAFGVTAAVVLGFSVADYFKIAFRDDPLLFTDLTLLREALNMTSGSYSLYWDTTMKLTALCAVLGLALLWFIARGRPGKKLRLGIALSGLALLIVMIPVSFSDSLYEKTANYTHLDSQGATTTQEYLAHGFVYPFLHSISDTFGSAPDDYDKQEAEALLAQYEDADIPEDQQVNVIAIMLEAYNDFTKFGVPELATDVYATWHQLEAEGYSGNLVTNIFAGGTVNTERCFLTGYSSLRDYRSYTNSYAWYFRSQGYTVEGMHPCYQWFYNRVNVNEYLGFSQYYFMENYFSDLTEWSTAGDSILIPELISAYAEATADGTPYFNFSVTYQGHGPYSDTDFYWGTPSDFVVNNGEYTDEEYLILCNYFASLADTNENLAVLADYLREDDEPVILVLFGDHNPWLGDGNSVYEALGINLDLTTQEGFLNYYSTRYIIWANDAAREVLGNDFSGEGPDLSPCFLMSELFDLCGWDGPAYMQAIDAVSEAVPVVHTSGEYLVDGTLTDTLDEENAELVRAYENVQYYYSKHFNYGKE